MKGYVAYLLPILLLLGLLPQNTHAQSYKKRIKQRFKAGVTAGFNLSQIDGDQYVGFNKGNPLFGLAGTAILTRRSQLGIELLYVGKGARTESRPGTTIMKDRIIDLNYMEVPFLYRYHTADEGMHTFLEGGFAFARLISSELQEPSPPLDGYFIKSLEPDFRRNELSLLLGAGVQLSEHFALRFRYQAGLTPFYRQSEADQALPRPITFSNRTNRIEFLRNYLLFFALQHDI